MVDFVIDFFKMTWEVMATCILCGVLVLLFCVAYYTIRAIIIHYMEHKIASSHSIKQRISWKQRLKTFRDYS